MVDKVSACPDDERECSVGREDGRTMGSCAGSFFVGVCDDIDPTDRFCWTLAPSTGGQGFWIVQHVAESCHEGERAKRRESQEERRLVVVRDLDLENFR